MCLHSRTALPRQSTFRGDDVDLELCLLPLRRQRHPAAGEHQDFLRIIVAAAGGRPRRDDELGGGGEDEAVARGQAHELVAHFEKPRESQAEFWKGQLQSGAAYHSLGFEDENLGSSPGWWAATVATYCPSRPGELPKLLSSKPCE